MSHWIERATAVFFSALAEAAPRISSVELVMLAVDCHPWNGHLGLALLTSDEVLEDPLLASVDEMAAWKHFNFSDQLAAWSGAAVLAEAMQLRYDSATDKAAAARASLLETAEALVSAVRAGALRPYNLAANFRVSVAHPDSGEEFYPPP